jgi:hypothetical protein
MGPARSCCVLVASTLLWAILFPSLTHPRTWYVKADSTGDAPTIYAALDSASYGDTVLVAPGTYVRTDDPEISFDPGPGITLVSEFGPDVTILEFCNTQMGIMLTNCEGACVSGFTIRHGTPGPDCGVSMGNKSGIICHSCTDVVVEDCVIEGRLSYGIRVDGESLEWWKPLFRNNTIRDCAYGISCVDVSQPGRPLFEGNIITSCDCGAEVRDAHPYFESCEITYSAGSGMVYSGHCGGGCDKCTIAHNAGNGVMIYSSPPLAAPSFNGSWLPENANDFYDNGGWDLWYEHTSPQGLVMAIYNYWGSDCPDFAVKIHGRVDYTPWMDSTHTLVFDEDDCPGATESSSWGSIKALFK